MQITLIRHTKVNVEPGICYGFSDVDVDTSFPEEAGSVAEGIQSHNFDIVWCSPLQRCRKLAAACGYPSPNIDDRLKELNCGEWEMKPWNEITDPALQLWYKDWINTRTTGGESLLDQYNRVAEFLDELRTQGHHHACIFAHGGVLRCALVYAGQLTLEEVFTVEIPYGHRIELTF